MSNVFEDIQITSEKIEDETLFTAQLKLEESLSLSTEDIETKTDLSQTARLTVAEKLIERVFQDAINYALNQGSPTPGRWLADQLIKKTRRHIDPDDIEAIRAPSLNDVEITKEKKEGRWLFTANLHLHVESLGPKGRPDKEAMTIFTEDLKARIRERALRMVHEWIQNASKDFSLFKVHTWIPGLQFYESRWISPENPVLLIHPYDTTELINRGSREQPIIDEYITQIEFFEKVLKESEKLMSQKNELLERTRKMRLLDRILGRWPE